ncbi:MAG: DUF4837 family protein [candidate division WOR-3 bacterium]
MKNRSKVKMIWALCTLHFALCILHCTNVPKSFGKLREVTVISDYWNQVGQTVEGILCRPIKTPQPEPEFLLRVGGFDRFKDYSRLRVVFLIGTRNDAIIKEILGFRLDSLVPNGFGLFKLPNAWSANQWVLVFAADDTAKLLQGLEVYSQRIHHTITEIVLEQMNKATYSHPRDEKLTEGLTRFGWTIDVPQKWLLQDRYSDSSFVYIFSHFPDRSVFVWWSDTVATLNLDTVLDIRDNLTKMFYEGDSVDRNTVVAERIEFLGVPCLRARGVWQNPKRVIGGPFVLYAFNYQGRFFLIDGVVFNPGEKKLSNLFQVEAIIRTFLPR